MELGEVIKTYSDMATSQLIGLVDDVDQLRKDCIPHLKNELLKRGELESVEKIDVFIDGGVKVEPVREEINIKGVIEANESIESVKEGLRGEGTNFATLNKAISDRREESNKRTNEILKFIVERSNLGDSIQKIDNELLKKFNLTPQDIKENREKLTKLSKRRTMNGLFLLIFSVVVAVFYSLFAYGYYKKGDFSFYFITVFLIMVYLFSHSGILLFQGRLFSRANKD